MRIARIARPYSLYDASVSAQTSEADDQVILNPIDFDEIFDVNLTNEAGNFIHVHI